MTNERVAEVPLTNERVAEEEEDKKAENRRPYVCDVCENMFDKLTQLEQHRNDTDMT